MTRKPARHKRISPGARVYRVECYDSFTFKVVAWLDRGPPDPKTGKPTIRRVTSKPIPAWAANEAKAVAAGWNKPIGTRNRERARPVRDDLGAGRVLEQAERPAGHGEAA